ncbi:MAG: RDD family protein [Terriglobia bacterium]
MAVAAPPGYSGANALAIAPSFETHFQTNETQDIEPARIPNTRTASPPDQTRLFKAPPQKVIAFDDLQRHLNGKTPPPPARPEEIIKRVVGPSRKPSTHVSKPVPEQTSLDFVPGSPFTQRTLKTAVPAQIYCELPVATPTHRFVASLLDISMILLGFGFFAGAVALSGGSFGQGKLFWITMTSVFALIAMFYGLIWAIAGRATAGMNWTDLDLITFDGFPVDARSRAARFASTWLSFCSAGLGLIWAVADEENLTWHDHISKTFPTVRNVSRSFVRPPRRQ